jgi:hypothetical protein
VERAGKAPMADSKEVTTSNLLMAEYEAIKKEQQMRIGFRDNLIYATLASLATVIVAALNFHIHAKLLLVLPPAVVVLGWTYLANDEKVTAIGRYIRRDLDPRLGKLIGESSPIFGWEGRHRDDKHRISRKYLQLAVDLIIFCLPGLAVLIAYWIVGPITPLLLVLSIIEAGGVLVLAAQIIMYADVAKGAA